MVLPLLLLLRLLQVHRRVKRRVAGAVVVVAVVVVVRTSPFLTLVPLACGRLFRKVLIDRDLRRRESSRATSTRHSPRR